MTISGYSNAIVDVMLGWLKGLANWVLRLFNLAGSANGSPLLWLSRNWLKLLIFFLVLGVVLDRLIWLIRWRPYWVWFRKERVIVNDSRFFTEAELERNTSGRGELRGNWDERDYIVASTVVRRKDGGEKDAGSRDRRRALGTEKPARGRNPKSVAPARRSGEGQGKSRRERGTVQRHGAGKQAAQTPDSIFSMDLKKPEASDVYEDEVFNVSNLPVFDEFDRKTSKADRRRTKKQA